MALITRVSRLFKADMNAVIDHIEEPEVVLKQSLRDMQEGVAVSQARLKALQAQLKQVDVYQAQAEVERRQRAEELDVCLDADNDELARSVVRRQLENAANLNELAGKRTELETCIAEQQRLVEEQLHDLQSLQQKIELLDSTVAPGFPQMSVDAITPEQVEVALLHEKQRRQGA